MINWFNMPDEGLSNGGLFEVKELEVTENGTYETSGEMYNKVTVNVEGGGGSSDFSTAEVTVVNNTGESIEGLFVSVADTPFSAVVPMNTLSAGTKTYNVPLYKGFCNWTISGIANVSVSGGIEWDSEYRDAFITGDCTITIS